MSGLVPPHGIGFILGPNLDEAIVSWKCRTPVTVTLRGSRTRWTFMPRTLEDVETPEMFAIRGVLLSTAKTVENGDELSFDLIDLRHELLCRCYRDGEKQKTGTIYFEPERPDIKRPIWLER